MNLIKVFLLISSFIFTQQIFAQDQSVFDYEQKRFNAQMELDVETLDNLLAEELIYIHSNTLTESKTDFIASVQSGKIVYQEMNIKRHQLRQYKKIAIVTGLVEVKGLFKDNEFVVELFYTSVYKKKKGKWLLLSWQSTSKK